MEQQFRKRCNEYTMLYEDDNMFIFAVKPKIAPTYYEVFKKRKNPERILPNGKVLPAGWKYPCDEDFGVWAWCCSNPDRVMYILKLKFNFHDILPCFSAYNDESGQIHYKPI